VYVANAGGTMSVIGVPADKVIGTFKIPEGAEAIAADPVTDLIYVAEPGSVLVISGTTRQVTSTIPAGSYADPGIAVNAGTDTIYVTGDNRLFDEGSVSVIDGQTNGVTSVISSPPGPQGAGYAQVAVDARANMAYAATTRAVMVINGATGQFQQRRCLTPH
jgi:DNA-binding beta-propeller fold protein YncE